MSERLIRSNGVELCTETFGDPDDPAILLIMGATASMLRWGDDFCQLLADGGRFVVRYDNRDVGQSTTYEPGAVPYTMEDMADDAIGVLDAYGIETAHLVGASMGGMICQHAALRHPDRIRTITPIMSTPDPSSIFGTRADGDTSEPLPSPTSELLAAMEAMLSLDPTDEGSAVAGHLGLAAVLDGQFHDADASRELFVREAEHARNFASAQNHVVAVTSTPRWRERLGEIRIPTLVLHGTADPILPFPHGEALAKAIPGASLLPMEGAGHDIPAALHDVVVPAILAHTAD